jgi:fluoroacetyl-CoA thioesterase
MAKTVTTGAKGFAEERVKFENTLSAHHHQLPPIYSTPDMIRLMETAGLNALQPFCEPGEISVGTTINVEHRAPAGLNSLIRAEAEVQGVEGRFITLKVTAMEGKTEIGSGTIRRAIVSLNKFLEKHGIPKP